MPTQPPELSAAFELLAGCVYAMEQRGAHTTAAGVAAEVKKARSTFDVKAFGYSKFRFFVEAAAAQGLVEVWWDRNGSDLVLRSPGVTTAPGITPGGAPGTVAGLHPPKTASRQIRTDLWRAFVASSTSGHYLFSRESGGLMYESGAPGIADEASVPVVSISDSEKLGWMRAFAERQSPAMSQRLLAATDGADSSDAWTAFYEALRTNTSVSKRWSKHYREKVLERLDAWASANDVPRRLVDAPTRVEPASRSTTPRAPALRQGPAWSPNAPGPTTVLNDDEIRAAICRAVMRMPVADLLRIPIPAEYMLR